MSWRLNKVQIYLLIGICTVILLMFTGLYYLQIQPMTSMIESKKSEVETQHTILDSISPPLNSFTDITYQSTMELQKKLPVKPLGDQLILELKKAEVISNSLILKMEITDEELSDTEEAGAVQETNTTDDAVDGGTNSNETEAEAETEPVDGSESMPEEQSMTSLPLPQGIKKLSVKVTVEADDYEEFEAFIETVESSKRIMKIDRIDLVGSEEIISIEQNVEPLVYTVEISAFYSPDLIDLQEQLPDMETPQPADKDNPLSIAPDVYPDTKKDSE